jgi:hypothetical protein
MDPPDLTQLAICAAQPVKAIRAEWKSRIGGIPVILVKGCLRRQEACANFFNLRKNRNRSQSKQDQELQEFGVTEYKRAAQSANPNPKPPVLQPSNTPVLQSSP